MISTGTGILEQMKNSTSNEYKPLTKESLNDFLEELSNHKSERTMYPLIVGELTSLEIELIFTKDEDKKMELQNKINLIKTRNRLEAIDSLVKRTNCSNKLAEHIVDNCFPSFSNSFQINSDSYYRNNNEYDDGSISIINEIYYQDDNWYYVKSCRITEDYYTDNSYTLEEMELNSEEEVIEIINKYKKDE